MKSIRLHDYLIHMYMLISILGFILVVSAGTLSRIPLILGASSWLIAIVVSSADATNWYISAFLFLWGISFLILLLVSYIMAWRKHQMPFLIIIAIDAIVALLWAISCLATNDMYAFAWAGPDAVVSVLYSVILMFGCLRHKPRDKRDAVLLPPTPKDGSVS